LPTTLASSGLAWGSSELLFERVRRRLEDLARQSRVVDGARHRDRTDQRRQCSYGGRAAFPVWEMRDELVDQRDVLFTECTSEVGVPRF
jgi:hypothetical protein